MSEQPEQKPKRPLRRWAIDLAVILLAFGALQWWQTRPLASGPAPELSGLTVSGQAVNLEDFRGKPVLVHFWAEWCPVCKAEQGNIQSIAEDLPVLTVAMQSGDRDAVRNHMTQEGLSFETIADPMGSISSAWGVQGVPASFVVDAEGTIRFTEIGYSTEPGLRARLWAAENL